MNQIEVHTMTKDYGNSQGIFDVSFTIKKGEIVGFLGANGAGKTTTIRHLMGFMKPETGYCKIQGLDCFEQAHHIQNDVGYLPGEIAFMDNMTGLQFIKFMASLKGITDMSYAHDLMKRFDLKVNTRIKKMSKGMKQKIGLIIALMQEPHILILDEPTSGLDPLMQKVFVETIHEAKEKGQTILMSSHIFEEIEHTCDRILMIKDGKLVIDEAMDTIKAKRKKHYQISFETAAEAQVFHAKQTESRLQDNTVSFEERGDTDAIIKNLSRYHISDITIRSQNLEEVFLEYYGGKQ